MLYLVATPIGNLGDISTRALETLQKVDVIASEDTRHTGLLLKHFGIKKPQMSFHEHNEERASEQIVKLIGEGKSVALVTDSGTPGISDPGFSIVRKAIQQDIPLTMIPGASALVIAVVLSGLPVHSFTFCGFAPRRQAARLRFLSAERESRHTLIFYESPYRIQQFLADALTIFGDRRAALGIELTKMFETMLRGTLSQLAQQTASARPRGEYAVVIAGADQTLQDNGTSETTEHTEHTESCG
jgi:16S rRNA (cytidine1402-2'-O)-methyltransferase